MAAGALVDGLVPLLADCGYSSALSACSFDCLSASQGKALATVS